MSSTSTKSKNYDALVIGGGIAGATSAYYLAKLGYQAKLYEKEKEAHHKVCGEYFSSETVQYLEELGIDFDECGASKISTFNLYSKYHRVSIDLDEDARGLSRFVLDELLIAKASQAGAVIERGVNFKNFEENECQKIFLATGKHDSPLHKRQGENVYMGFKMHYRLLDEDDFNFFDANINIFLYKGGYAGLSFVENKVLNLCLVIDKEIYKNYCKNFDGLVNYLKANNKFLAQHLSKITPVWDKPVTVSNIPYGYITKLEEQHLVGDQYAVIPSVSGNGMAIAYLTAKNEVLNFHSQDHKNDLIEKVSLKQKVNLAYFFHQAIKIPLIASIAVFFFACCPWVLALVLRKTRME